MGIRVNIDLDVDGIFNNEEFLDDLNRIIRDEVLHGVREAARKGGTQIYQDHSQEISEDLMKAYRENHEQFMKRLR